MIKEVGAGAQKGSVPRSPTGPYTFDDQEYPEFTCLELRLV